jgi:hypothetical protein
MSLNLIEHGDLHGKKKKKNDNIDLKIENIGSQKTPSLGSFF